MQPFTVNAMTANGSLKNMTVQIGFVALSASSSSFHSLWMQRAKSLVNLKSLN